MAGIIPQCQDTDDNYLLCEVNPHSFLLHGLNSVRLYKLCKPVGSAAPAIIFFFLAQFSLDCKGNIRACI